MDNILTSGQIRYRKYRETYLKYSREMNTGLRKKSNEKFKLANPLFVRWSSMKDRCFNSNNKGFCSYGARGITVSEEWLIYKNFENDMLPTFKKGLQLDRINNNGNYCKENCRWVTQKENANNTSKSVYVTYKDRTKTIYEWAEHLGFKYGTLYSRVKHHNWDIEKALTTPVK